MICPGVHANSVHSCNAGNANGRLNRGLESRAWLESVPCLAPWNIPWNICSCANGHRLVFHANLVEHAYLLRFIANSNCSHLFTEQTSGQVLHSLCRILPEAEGKPLHYGFP
jgi:hypothetical protein